MRDQAYNRIKRVCDEKLVSIFDFETDPHNIFTAHEMLAQVDGSLSTKFTVQFNLFGGTLTGLYSERHLPIMRQVDSLKNMGCFCFTELGYGNNAPEMETTAHYDHSTQQFTIHSPSVLSQKFWITNGACHANYAIVFAQTIVRDKNEGVNAFIVPIRDDNMKPCAGVTIEDMGMKIGLNGIDNARLTFSHVKIPRINMLNRLADVNEKGEFICDIKKRSNRFFKVADRLLSGRLCISAMSLAGTKNCLWHAIKYSQQRLAIGESGESDTPIMSYQLQ
jgi:acyl-CoA oxidase